MRYDLKIGEGIGPFKFGMTPSEVMDVYGIPSRRDIICLHESMYYHGDKLELHFYGDQMMFLTHIDFYLEEDIYYQNEQIRGLSKDYLINTLFGDIQDWEITDDEGDYEDYYCPEKRLSLTFVDDRLDSVDLGKPKEEPKTILEELKHWLCGKR